MASPWSFLFLAFMVLAIYIGINVNKLVNLFVDLEKNICEYMMR